MRISFLSIIFLASKVIADGVAIVNAIDEVANTTESLNETVANVSPRPSLSLPLAVTTSDCTMN